MMIGPIKVSNYTTGKRFQVNEIKRRITVYPGQVSLVFNIKHAEEFLAIFSENVSKLSDHHQPVARRFLQKMDSAINTGKRLSAKQSAKAKGNFQPQ